MSAVAKQGPAAPSPPAPSPAVGQQPEAQADMLARKKKEAQVSAIDVCNELLTRTAQALRAAAAAPMQSVPTARPVPVPSTPR